MPYLKKYLNLIQAVYFYGAGCSSKENKLKLKHAVRNILSVEEIHIEHDMLGAARATCKREKGIVGILGTGSNACIYGGLSIIQTAASYGYLFGDYGSGAHIGKMFIQHYCDKTLPKELRIKYEQAGYNDEKILSVYQHSLPSRFLASIFPFIYGEKEHPFVKELFHSSLRKYFEIQVLPIVKESVPDSLKKEYAVHFVGSVASLLREEITEIAGEYQLETKSITKHPINGLIEYHQKY
ncbi:MAG: ATPase [Bacteroidia bacterium]|nr:MAG: ATPase [Bacteroidia bacterium]